MPPLKEYPTPKPIISMGSFFGIFPSFPAIVKAMGIVEETVLPIDSIL